MFNIDDAIISGYIPNEYEPVGKTEEKKTNLLRNQKIPKTKKKKSNEYLKKLKEENQNLKKLIAELEKNISTKELENKLLLNQLSFFNKQLPVETEKEKNETKN